MSLSYGDSYNNVPSFYFFIPHILVYLLYVLQINSTGITNIGDVKKVEAIFISITEVHCNISVGVNTASYLVGVSNDGINYNTTMMQQFIVFNSDCMSCDLKKYTCVERVSEIYRVEAQCVLDLLSLIHVLTLSIQPIFLGA